MSFLKDVICTADKAMTVDIYASKPQIEEKVLKLKSEITDHMENIFLKYSPSEIDHANILHVIEEIDGDIKKITSGAKEVKTEISNSTSELQSLMDSLKETIYSLQISKILFIIDQHFTDIAKARKIQDYVQVATILKELNVLLTDTNCIQQLNIFERMDMKCAEENAIFQAETKAAWNKYLQISEFVQHKTKIVEIKITTDEIDKLHSLITAFTIYDDKSYLIRFSQFLMKKVLTPIITQVTSITTSDENSCGQQTYQTMVLSINEESSDTAHYTDVFNNIIATLEFVGAINIPIDDEDECVFTKIGKLIKKQFCDILIKECLVHTIPTTPEELDDLKAALCIEGLHEKLTQMYFFNEKDTDILSYSRNFDALFASKICQTTLNEAREIMKKDLHNMVEVGEGTNETDLNVTDMKTGVAFICSPMIFPKCVVSKNVQELQDYIQHSVLDKAASSSEMCRGRLLATAVNIIKLYQIVVPVCHEHLIIEIPQQTALFHNNCMYLAHWLLTLNFQLKSKNIFNFNNIPALFVNEVFGLKALGCQHFLTQMRRQKAIILDIVRNSDLSSISEVSELKTTFPAVQQCLRQLKLLRSVWDKILPDNVYCRSIGSLLNAFIEELIQRVCSIEDIPANIAIQLVRIFNTVTEESMLIFEESSDIFRYVKYWQKLKELTVVLGANLIEIRDRWSNGSGPLATVFKADEVKKLIRALFQNTDRRAEILSKIK